MTGCSDVWENGQSLDGCLGLEAVFNSVVSSEEMRDISGVVIDAGDGQLTYVSERSSSAVQLMPLTCLRSPPEQVLR